MNEKMIFSAVRTDGDPLTWDLFVTSAKGGGAFTTIRMQRCDDQASAIENGMRAAKGTGAPLFVSELSEIESLNIRAHGIALATDMPEGVQHFQRLTRERDGR